MVRSLFTFITLILLTVFADHMAKACDKQVDDKQVILFIDTNLSLEEVEAADKSACERGEKLIVLPRPNEWKAYVGARRAYEDCEKQRISSSCADTREQAAKNYKDIEHGPKVNEALIRQAFKSLARGGQIVTSLILSGHDGGGHFVSDGGDAEKLSVISAFKDAYREKPEALSRLRSVYLWGCYTTTPGEVLAWKDALPNLSVIAGFANTAPFSRFRSSSDLLGDILIKEKSIIGKSDEMLLKNALGGLDKINQTLAGIYVKTCNNEEWYLQNYPKYKFRDSRIVRVERIESDLDHWSSFVGCDSVDSALESFREQHLAYFYGERPIPGDIPTDENSETTHRSALRLIYSATRSYQHCISEENYMHPDRVALLLFFNGVKKNFAVSFAPLIKRAGAEISVLEREINGIKKDNSDGVVVDAKRILKIFRKEFFLPTFDNIEGKTRRQILRDIALLEGLTKHPIFEKRPELKSKIKNLVELRKKMDRYLYNLDSKCMDVLEWHQYREGVVPKGRC